jgi:hypothetical protein
MGPKSWLKALILALAGWAAAGAISARAAEAKTYWFFVFSNPVAGTEADYNRWYTDQHQRDVVAVPGFVSVQRAVLAEKQLINRPDAPTMPKYLALYTIRTDDLKAVMAEVARRVQSGRTVISPTYDRKTSVGYTYELTGRLEAPLAAPPGAKPGPMQTYLHIVYTVPFAGKEAAFNQWYDTHHAPEMLHTPGIVVAQRLTLADPGHGAPAASQYAAAFTLKTTDEDALIKAFAADRDKRFHGDSMNGDATFGYTYRLLGPEVSGDAVRASRAKGGH